MKSISIATFSLAIICALAAPLSADNKSKNADNKSKKNQREQSDHHVERKHEERRVEVKHADRRNDGHKDGHREQHRDGRHDGHYDAHRHNHHHGHAVGRSTSSFSLALTASRLLAPPSRSAFVSIDIGRPPVHHHHAPVYPTVVVPAAPPVVALPAPYPAPHGPVSSLPPAPAPPILAAPTGPSFRVSPPFAEPVSELRPGCFVRQSIPIYDCIRVEDRKNIAPGFVTMFIAVRDPRLPETGCAPSLEACVVVPVCVPPCPCRRIDVSHNGNRINLDYGKYEVTLKSRNGVVTVDYDD